MYYITELDEPECMGIIVDKLIFTHPQHLVAICETLRKQLLFNELLLSCMRKLYTNTIGNSSGGSLYEGGSKRATRIIEIGLIEPFVLSIILQHPRLLCYTTS